MEPNDIAEAISQGLIRIDDVRLDRGVVDVTALGGRKEYLPVATEVHLSGTIDPTNATWGWFGNNTGSNTYTIHYTDNTAFPTMLKQPVAEWVPEKPKKKSNDPLDWLHDRVEDVCSLGYLDD